MSLRDENELIQWTYVVYVSKLFLWQSEIVNLTKIFYSFWLRTFIKVNNVPICCYKQIQYIEAIIRFFFVINKMLNVPNILTLTKL